MYTRHGKNNWTVGSSGPPTKAKRSNNRGLVLAAKSGYTAFEAPYGRSMLVADSTIESLHQVATEQGVALSLHGNYFTSVLNNPRKEQADCNKYVGLSVRLASLANVPVVIHPGGAYKGSVKSQLDLVTERLEVSLYGYNPELVYLETCGKIDSFGHLLELVTIADRLGTRICVDIAHEYAKAIASNRPFGRNQIRTILTVLEDFTWAREGNAYFHLSGMKVNSGGEDSHLPLDSNTVPYVTFIEELLASQLKGRIIVETDRDNGTSQNIIMELLGVSTSEVSTNE